MEPQLAKELEKYFSKESFIVKEGETIITPEDTLTHIHFLKRGTVRQYVITQSGVEVTLHIFRPTSFFPAMLFLAEVSNRYYFEALGQVEIKKAPAELVLKEVKSDPNLLFDLTKRFSLAIDGLNTRLESLLSGRAKDRVAALLAYYANKFGGKSEGGVVIKLKLTHTEIASWIGLSRETVSRKLSDLKKQGIIDYEQGLIVIKNTDLLLKTKST